MGEPIDAYIEQYSFLWDGSEQGWVLGKLSSDDDVEDDHFVILNEVEHDILTICENDLLYSAVIERMLAAGVKVKLIVADPVRLQVQQQLGQWVNRERIKRGWSLKQLGGRLALKPLRLVELEQGHFTMDWWLLNQITKVFGVTLVELAVQAELNTIDGAEVSTWLMNFYSLSEDEQFSIRQQLQRSTKEGI